MDAGRGTIVLGFAAVRRGATARGGVTVGRLGELLRVALLGALAFAGGGGAPRFVSEDVRVTIEDDTMTVTGRYRFVGGRARENLAIFYPFPSESTLGRPEILRVTVVTQGPISTPCSYDLEVLGARMILPLASADRCELQVTYRQQLGARRAVYLLTTTRSWEEPLDEAVLEVECAEALGIPRFSLPFAAVHRRDGRQIYRFAAAPFLPDTELIVEW